MTIAAGSLANYAFASVLLFAGLLATRHGVAEAAWSSLTLPLELVRDNGIALGRWVTRHGHVALSGPVGIVKMAASQARMGPWALLQFIGLFSAAMGAFNLLPFPFLDGGRLLVLGAEAISRRQANARIEAWVHAAEMLVLLAVMGVATYGDVVAR